MTVQYHDLPPDCFRCVSLVVVLSQTGVFGRHCGGTLIEHCAAIGMLFKRGATISAAEGGCMAEVGVACSMAVSPSFLFFTLESIPPCLYCNYPKLHTTVDI